MLTFLIGLAILIIGGFFYGIYVENMFGPDDRVTPAVSMNDGVDYVPMGKWKNSLIELLNIAGTGPILGPILGILFGPIAFIAIPVGCVLGGALHDYLSGMISIREKGAQMPALVKKYLGNSTFQVYNIFVCLLMLLVGAVFVYTPGDLIVTSIFKQKADVSNPLVLVVYIAIFIYYLVATLFPIDKIIGKVYPIFGAVLVLSAVGIFAGIFLKGYQLDNLTADNWRGIHPDGLPFIPIFFVTVACGIVSGFHSTQATLIGRSVKSEKEGKLIFFNMMLVEGFIAMTWAAAAMGIYNKGISPDAVGKPVVISLVANDLLGTVGGLIAIIGVIVLPITSGDTALRSLRLMVAEYFNIEQKKPKNRLIISSIIFVAAGAILWFAKTNAKGFQILWQYFAWSNQTISIFAFAMIVVYLVMHNKNFVSALIPGSFYTFIITTYILQAKIGFNLPLKVSYLIGAVLTVIYAVLAYLAGVNKKGSMQPDTAAAVNKTQQGVSKN